MQTGVKSLGCENSTAQRVAEPVVEADRAFGGLRLEIRRRVVDLECHVYLRGSSFASLCGDRAGQDDFRHTSSPCLSRCKARRAGRDRSWSVSRRGYETTIARKSDTQSEPCLGLMRRFERTGVPFDHRPKDGLRRRSILSCLGLGRTPIWLITHNSWVSRRGCWALCTGSAATRATATKAIIVMSANVFSCHYSGAAPNRVTRCGGRNLRRRWLPVDLEPVTGSCFAVEISGTKHSFLDLCNMQATPVHIRRRNDIVPDAAGHRFLLVASGTRLQARQRGKIRLKLYLSGRWFW